MIFLSTQHISSLSFTQGILGQLKPSGDVMMRENIFMYAYTVSCIHGILDKISYKEIQLHQGAITMSCDKTLKAKGYKLTPQRRMVLDLLHESHAHLTAEDIVKRIHANAPDVNKSTVYRTLELLVELEMVVKSKLEGKFVYHHGDSGHHHHFVCHGCGKIMDGDEIMLLPLQRILLSELDFQPDLKHLVIHGLCGVCRRQ